VNWESSGLKGGKRVEAKNKRKVITGKVVSNKMDKTVVVAVETLVRHPLYQRIIRQTKKFKAHDEKNACRNGDKVRLMETRPLSKEKRWRVIEILERSEQI
jgi:small subunit ribosomal protein S17